MGSRLECVENKGMPSSNEGGRIMRPVAMLVIEIWTMTTKPEREGLSIITISNIVDLYHARERRMGLLMRKDGPITLIFRLNRFGRLRVIGRNRTSPFLPCISFICHYSQPSYLVLLYGVIKRYAGFCTQTQTAQNCIFPSRSFPSQGSVREMSFL